MENKNEQMFNSFLLFVDVRSCCCCSQSLACIWFPLPFLHSHSLAMLELADDDGEVVDEVDDEPADSSLGDVVVVGVPTFDDDDDGNGGGAC